MKTKSKLLLMVFLFTFTSSILNFTSQSNATFRQFWGVQRKIIANLEDYTSEWTNDTITASLRAQDSSWFIRRNYNFYYRKNDGKWYRIANNTRSTSYSIKSSGEYEFAIGRDDNGSNFRIYDKVKVSPIKIDQVKPSATINPNGGKISKEQIFEISSKDQGGSGLENIKYRILYNNDSSSSVWTKTNPAFTISIPQIIAKRPSEFEISNFKIQVTLKDKAGNTSSNTSKTFQLVDANENPEFPEFISKIKKPILGEMIEGQNRTIKWQEEVNPNILNGNVFEVYVLKTTRKHFAIPHFSSSRYQDLANREFSVSSVRIHPTYAEKNTTVIQSKYFKAGDQIKFKVRRRGTPPNEWSEYSNTVTVKAKNPPDETEIIITQPHLGEMIEGKNRTIEWEGFIESDEKDGTEVQGTDSLVSKDGFEIYVVKSGSNMKDIFFKRINPTYSKKNSAVIHSKNFKAGDKIKFKVREKGGKWSEYSNTVTVKELFQPPTVISKKHKTPDKPYLNQILEGKSQYINWENISTAKNGYEIYVSKLTPKKVPMSQKRSSINYKPVYQRIYPTSSKVPYSTISSKYFEEYDVIKFKVRAKATETHLASDWSEYSNLIEVKSPKDNDDSQYVDLEGEDKRLLGEPKMKDEDLFTSDNPEAYTNPIKELGSIGSNEPEEEKDATKPKDLKDSEEDKDTMEPKDLKDSEEPKTSSSGIFNPLGWLLNW